MSPKTSIIGLGNPLRRDDAIGILVVRALRDHYRRSACDYLDFGTASFDLLHRFQSYDRLLLIDAIKAPGIEPGGLVIKDVENFHYQTNLLPASTHELDLTALFEMAKSLGAQPVIYVAGIQAADLSFQEGLTAALEVRFDAIVREVAEFIDKELIGQKE